MKKLYVSEDWFSIQQVAQMLEAHRIPFMVKNEFSAGAIGELSPLDAVPEVWLLDDDWFARASSLLTDLKRVASNGSDWRCDHCGEHNDASFEICWQCGAVNPAEPSSEK